MNIGFLSSNSKICSFTIRRYFSTHKALLIVEKSVNILRNFPYGDQSFCILSEFHIKMNLYSDIPIMEDVDYINKIPINNRYNVINDYIITSDRRFRNIDGLSYKSIVTNFNNGVIKMN